MGEFQKFNETEWIRDSFSSTNEERPARPEDMIDISNEKDDANNTIDFSDYYDSPSGWKKEYPRYQEVLNRYVMRRWVFVMSAHKECPAGSITAEEINAFIEESDIVSIPLAKVSGGQMLMPGPDENKIYLISFGGTDTYQAGKSVVTATWKRSGKWTRHKVEEL